MKDWTCDALWFIGLGLLSAPAYVIHWSLVPALWGSAFVALAILGSWPKPVQHHKPKTLPKARASSIIEAHYIPPSREQDDGDDTTQEPVADSPSL